MKTKAAKITHYFKSTFYGLMVIFLGYLTIFMGIHKNEDRLDLRLINIKTSSMYPSIRPSSFLVTVPQNKYRVGDIITYKVVDNQTNYEYSQTLTHRIIEIKEEGDGKVYVTKGDSNVFPDAHHADEKNILGKVVLVVPRVGHVITIIKTIPGFLMLIAFPSYLLIKNEAIYLKNELKRHLLAWS